MSEVPDPNQEIITGVANEATPAFYFADGRFYLGVGQSAADSEEWSALYWSREDQNFTNWDDAQFNPQFAEIKLQPEGLLVIDSSDRLIKFSDYLASDLAEQLEVASFLASEEFELGPVASLLGGSSFTVSKLYSACVALYGEDTPLPSFRQRATKSKQLIKVGAGKEGRNPMSKLYVHRDLATPDDLKLADTYRVAEANPIRLQRDAIDVIPPADQTAAEIYRLDPSLQRNKSKIRPTDFVELQRDYVLMKEAVVRPKILTPQEAQLGRRALAEASSDVDEHNPAMMERYWQVNRDVNAFRIDEASRYGQELETGEELREDLY